METKELWEEFYKDGKYIMWEPSEATIKFFGRVSKEKDIKGLKALDFGCGVGRNVIFMEKLGLDTYGIDNSKEAIKLAQERNSGYEDLFYVYNGSKIPFYKEYFDFVISHGVLDHVLFGKAKALMKEIHRVSKPNGLVELEIHSTYDSRYQEGIEIDKNTYIIEDECEKGIPQHFFGKSELPELIEGFTMKKLYLNEERDLSGGPLNYNLTSFWVLYLQKKEDNRKEL